MSKLDVLKVKKNGNRHLKFRNNEIFINEHPSPENRALIARALEKKKAKDYKFLWTKGGLIYMQKMNPLKSSPSLAMKI